MIIDGRRRIDGYRMMEWPNDNPLSNDSDFDSEPPTNMMETYRACSRPPYYEEGFSHPVPLMRL